MPMQTIQVIDSHTGGEPTRIVVEHGPSLGNGPLAERMLRFQEHFDRYRSAVVDEPRGSEVLVGGLLCEPHEPDCTAGVLFFNTAGYLGMCGHGTIGLVTTLHHLGRATVGVQRIDTPVGPVNAELFEDGRVRVDNVASYRHLKDVRVEVPGLGWVNGDVAYGGNWFFLVKESPPLGLDLDLGHARRLTDITLRIRSALAAQGVTGAEGAFVDHVELFGAPEHPGNHSRNFVLCPGTSYDRSPCGTGTSAKLACLAADGQLEPGASWNQESITGSVFSCSYQPSSTTGRILPSITGSAHITAEASLIIDPSDSLGWGLRP